MKVVLGSVLVSAAVALTACVLISTSRSELSSPHLDAGSAGANASTTTTVEPTSSTVSSFATVPTPPSSTTTTKAERPRVSSTSSTSHVRRLIGQSRHDVTPAWQLFAVGEGRSRCIELDVKGRRFRGLLCGARQTEHPVGDLVTLDLGAGDIGLVAVLGEQVHHLAPVLGEAVTGRGEDVDRSAGSDLAVGVTLMRRDTAATGALQVVARSYFSTPRARIDVPSEPGSIRANNLRMTTGGVYDFAYFWRAGPTGNIDGGLQEIGTDHGCVVQVRLGGDDERVIGRHCAKRTSGVAVPWAGLLPYRSGVDSRLFHLMAIIDVYVERFTCSLPDGRPCDPAKTILLPDYQDTQRRIAADAATPIRLPDGVTSVTLRFFDHRGEVGSVVASVEGAPAGRA